LDENEFSERLKTFLTQFVNDIQYKDLGSQMWTDQSYLITRGNKMAGAVGFKLVNILASIEFPRGSIEN
jgi:hypothetical protein